jgi:uncharacterized protein YyaL (SSP411 family)
VPNALAHETSPYLRQHASNPVDWLPWGSEALARAEAEGKPLLVSIGYSACHWCHVMAAESFEDKTVAGLMNERFVCVKVDREERPDIDALYMDAVQAMTGGGGWPLNVFLTPEQLPFFGGTYYPPQPRPGMPSWTQVLEAIAEAWQEQASEIRERMEQIRGRLSGAAQLSPSSAPFDPQALTEAVERLADPFDRVHGGFGGAPKFPQPCVIEFLLGEWAFQGDRQAGEMATVTLDAIAAGGMHDLVGGGFHRYAVDEQWAVPHFEKMLYDNALLAGAFLHAHKLTGEKRPLEVCLDALEFMRRELRADDGGFYAALDADAGGIEGVYYCWTIPQLQEALGGQDAELAIAWTGATAEGNFRDPHHPIAGLNVLSDRPGRPRPDSATARRVRERLLEVRERRERPALDTKRLTSWNALAISAFAQAGAYLVSMGSGHNPDLGESNAVDRSMKVSRPGASGGFGTLTDGQTLIEEARACADFVLRHLRDDAGRLLRTYNEGVAHTAAFLEDHAFLLEALVTLYEATFEERWLIQARRLADETIERFGDTVGGGFFSTAADAEPLPVRRKEIDDSPIPSGSSSATLGLLRLAALTGEARYEQAALSALQLTHELAVQHPLAFGHMLQALRLAHAPIAEVAVVGPPGEQRDALVRVVRERHRPQVVLAIGAGDGTQTAVPLLTGRTSIEGRPAAYVCERFTCLRPVTKPARLAALLGDKQGSERS